VPERAFLSIVSADVAASSRWYVELFGFEVAFTSDWFVHLQDPANASLELGFLARDHEIVTDELRHRPAGGLLTLVVADVDALHREALARGIEVLEPPTDLFYGQRRMLIADLDGQVVDVSSECDPDPAWLATLGA
jgi:catechol 2,3-dioxygenase-like lactoylglutathione lyase family enzyme